MSGVIHQASAVALNGQALLLEGAPGSGKSSLALALIDRGATLIGDDAVQLELRDGQLWASPPPNIPGKLEIRHVGLVDLPVTQAPVALVLRLEEGAARYVEQAGKTTLCGLSVPLIQLPPHDAIQVLKAEWALKLHGAPASRNGTR